MEADKQHSSSRGWLVVVAACLVMFAPTYAQMQVSPIAAAFMETYGIGEAEYMSAFTAPNLAPLFLSFVAGILLDRFGTKKVVLVAMSITLAGCIGRVLAAGYVPLYCSSILIGVATGFMTTGAAKLMTRFFPIDKIGLPVGILFAAASVANVVAAGTTAYLPSTHAAFVVSAVIAAVAVAAWALIVPGEGTAADEGQSASPKVGEMLKGVLTCKDVYLVIIANMCLGVMGFTIAGMLPTAMASRGMNVTDAGLMAAVYSAGSLLGAIITPAVSAKVRNQKVFMILLSAVLAALFPLIMVVPLGPVLIVVLLVIGIISYGLVPVLMSMPVRFEKVGVERAGTAGGLVATVQSAGISFLPGMLIIPLAGGNYQVLFVILAIMSAITLVCALLMHIPRSQSADTPTA